MTGTPIDERRQDCCQRQGTKHQPVERPQVLPTPWVPNFVNEVAVATRSCSKYVLCSLTRLDCRTIVSLPTSPHAIDGRRSDHPPPRSRMSALQSPPASLLGRARWQPAAPPHGGHRQHDRIVIVRGQPQRRRRRPVLGGRRCPATWPGWAPVAPAVPVPPPPSSAMHDQQMSGRQGKDMSASSARSDDQGRGRRLRHCLQ